ncbi:MAG: beta-ribofuranosylaminobenzene 5'-phosphate synthase [Methanobacterium sp.]|jgi:beta-ribofuranosylaminobenzene 5'-phosphate synthase
MMIETPSRLHVTLIDLNGKYGRIDGGVGITIREPKLILEAENGYESNEIIFTNSTNLNSGILNDYHVKINNAIIKTNQFLGLNENYHFNIREYYPSHSGLGSGTQLSLAVAKLILKINGQDLPANEIAGIVGRGGTSGIGVASFDHGGFIVDGGHKTIFKHDFLPSSASKASPPPILAKYDFPKDWNLILVIPQAERKVSGDHEVNIFQEYCPIPLMEVQKLTYILLMKMMPAVVEGDLDDFGQAVNIIQGVGFKKIESDLQNSFTNYLIESLRSAGASGVGLSSFGPTIYAVTDTNTKDICRTARSLMKDKEGEIISSKAQNSGAIIKG